MAEPFTCTCGASVPVEDGAALVACPGCGLEYDMVPPEQAEEETPVAPPADAAPATVEPSAAEEQIAEEPPKKNKWAIPLGMAAALLGLALALAFLGPKDAPQDSRQQGGRTASAKPADADAVPPKLDPKSAGPVQMERIDAPPVPRPAEDGRRIIADWGMITCVALAPGGKQAVTGTSSGALVLWDTQRGQEIRRLKGHTLMATTVSFAADGQRILSGGQDTTVRLWDIATGTEQACLTGHSEAIVCAALSPDGRRVLSGGLDRTVRLWDAGSGQELRRFTEPAGYVWSVAFSPDGRKALSATGAVDKPAAGVPLFSSNRPTSHDCFVRLWDLESGKELRRFTDYADLILALAFAPDGLRFASGGADHSVRVVDLESGKELHKLLGHAGPVRSVTFAAAGPRVFSAGEIRIGKVHKPGLVEHIVAFGSLGILAPVALQEWNYTLPGMRLCTHDGNSGQELRRFDEPAPAGALGCAFSPDGGQLLVGGRKSLKLWAVDKNKALFSVESKQHRLNSVAISADGKRALSGGDDHLVRLWSLENGEEIRRFEGHTSGVLDVALTADGLNAVSADHAGIVRIWSVQTGKELRRLPDPKTVPRTVTIASRAGRIATISPDCRQVMCGTTTELIFWDLRTGTAANQWQGQKLVFHSTAFSANGMRVIIGGETNVDLWDRATGKVLQHFAGHKRSEPASDTTIMLPAMTHFYTPAVKSVSLSPNGRLALSGGGDGCARLWEVASGNQLHELSGHKGTVLSVAFSPDNVLAASGGNDNTVRVWDVGAGREYRRYQGSSRVARVLFTPDSRKLLCGFSDGIIMLWDLGR